MLKSAIYLLEYSILGEAVFKYRLIFLLYIYIIFKVSNVTTR
jgi:hypothetical protein